MAAMVKAAPREGDQREVEADPDAPGIAVGQRRGRTQAGEQPVDAGRAANQRQQQQNAEDDGRWRSAGRLRVVSVRSWPCSWLHLLRLFISSGRPWEALPAADASAMFIWRRLMIQYSALAPAATVRAMVGVCRITASV